MSLWFSEFPLFSIQFYKFYILGAPLLITIFSYFITKIGIVPVVIHQVEWTTPVLLSGYIATNSNGAAIATV